GDYIVLDIVGKSSGTAIAVSDDEIMDALFGWARGDGLFASPEGAASLAAYLKLIANGFLSRKEKVVLFNTGLGLKYIDVVAAAMKVGGSAKKSQPESRNIGGIIGPY